MNCLSEPLVLVFPVMVLFLRCTLKDKTCKGGKEKIIELVSKNIRPRSIMTLDAFRNAIAVDMAFGGSSNTALHLPAIAP